MFSRCWREAAFRRGVSIASSLPRRIDWNLRDYGTGTWEGGDDPACDHTRKRHTKRSFQGGTCQAWVDEPAAIYPDTCGKCGARRRDKQLGLEPTVEAYVARMVEVFRLVREVLADHAVAFIKGGDTYFSGDAPRAVSYDTGGIIPEDSPGRDCPSESLCDACRGLADRSAHKDLSPVPTPALSPSSSSRGRRAKSNGRPANSGSSRRANRSAFATPGQPPEQDRGDGQPPAIPVSGGPGESSPPLREGSPPSSSESCGPSGDRSFLDGVPSSAHKSDAPAEPSDGKEGSASPCEGLENHSQDISACCSQCGASIQTPQTHINPHRTIVRNCSHQIQPGSLCLIPWRLALALQADGWLVRSVIVWSKPSPMPQSLSGWAWRRCRVKVKGVGNEADGWGRTSRVYDPAIGGQRYQSVQW